jgi:hypothetical protein
MGQRLIDDLLAKSGISQCSDFRETAEVIAKVQPPPPHPHPPPPPQIGFKMFLGVSATVANWNADGNVCSLILDENPLNDFVELPEQFKALKYSNILCGVIRGALEMVAPWLTNRVTRSRLTYESNVHTPNASSAATTRPKYGCICASLPPRRVTPAGWRSLRTSTPSTRTKPGEGGGVFVQKVTSINEDK